MSDDHKIQIVVVAPRMLNEISFCTCLYDREQTGIGKTVANVRKLDGEAGRLARKLVQQWKEIVAKLESADKKKVSLSSKSSVEQSEGKKCDDMK